jgi:outer membrane protein assembly factor BamB
MKTKRCCLQLILFLSTSFSWSSGTSFGQTNENWNQFRLTPQLTGVVESKLRAPLKLVWMHEAGDAIESSAAIVDQKVYVGESMGKLLALQLSDGKLLWEYEASDYGIGESSPAVHEGVVYIGDLWGNVHAVSAETGKRIWIYETQGEIRSSPVIVDSKILIGSYDENLYCLSTSGKLLWKVRSEGPLHATVGVLDGIGYISGCDGVLRGIRVENGEEVSQFISGSYTGASAALSKGFAYFGTHDNEVLAINLKENSLAWSYRHPTRHFPFYSSAAVVGNKVILGGQDKMVHCLNSKTGEAIWTFRTRARVDSSPAVVGNQIFIGSNDGRLYVLDIESGEKIWHFEAGDALYASPSIASNRLVIGTLDGQLFCLTPE